MTSDQRSATTGREAAASQRAGDGHRLSRKDVLALLGAGFVCVPVGAGMGCQLTKSGDDDRSDVEILNDALALEYSGVAVYGLDLDPLSAELREIAERFAEQGAEHVARLTKLVSERGGTPREPRPDQEYREKLKFGGLDDEEGFIEVAIELEQAAVAGYTEAVTDLSAPELRRLFFEIAANAAAHISVLLGVAGEAQVPDAFVTGQPR